MKEKYCPFCGLKLTNGGRHIYSCKKRDFSLNKDQIKLKYIQYNFGNNILDNICNDYENLYSLPMLKTKYNGIDNKSIIFLLNIRNIKIRNISESANKISKEKYKKTLQEKYGENITNISQVPGIKEKVKQAFLKHYGVDNIWKLQGYNKRCAELHPDSHREHMKKLLIGKYKKFKNGIYVSTLENRFCNILNDLNISYIHQFYISSYYHPYDFRLLKTNIIFEINGDYWHCNPKIYKNDYYHELKKMTAQEIWESDKKHIKYANDHNYKVIEIWESDMNKYNDEEFKEYLINLLKNI